MDGRVTSKSLSFYCRYKLAGRTPPFSNRRNMDCWRGPSYGLFFVVWQQSQSCEQEDSSYQVLAVAADWDV
jgi:hypothetical protein